MNVTPEPDLPKSRADVVFRPLDDSWVLFDPRAGQLHVLNLSAALVWEHLDGESSREAIAEAVPVPVIASGGVGNLQHLVDGVKQGLADAVLAASIFHFAEYSIGEAKRFMADQGVEVRL